MNNKILYEGKVIDVEDPKGLGRIRVEPQEWYIDNVKNIREFNDNTDKWVDNTDPFIFRPFLPNYLNIIPQEGEPVILLYTDTELQHFGGYYIPMSITDRAKPDSASYEQRSKYSRRGLNYEKSPDLLDEFGNFKRKLYDGAFPTKDEFGFSGRGNSDVRFTNKSLIMRAGQMNMEQTKRQGVPIRDSNPAMVQLTLFDDITQKSQVGVSEEVEFQTKQMSSLIEYNIIFNGTNNFNYTLSLYDISNSDNVNSRSMGLYSLPTSKNLVTVVSNEQPLSNINDVISEIRYYIKKTLQKANKGNHGRVNEINDNVKQNKGMKNTYPFYFRPTNDTYVNAQEGNGYTINDLEKLRVKTRKGWGLVFDNKEMDTPSITRTVPKYGTRSIGSKKVITQLSDINLLLSYENNTASDGIPIDFNTISNKEIDAEQIGKMLDDNTYSMVRGEKLYELIFSMYQFLISHVHNPAAPGVSTPEIRRNMDQKMVNFISDILSTKNRIN